MNEDLRILAPGVTLDGNDIEWQAIRARGPGGQHVNKTATAVELRFDINASGLPGAVKQRLLAGSDRRISDAGVIVIRAQDARSQKRNRKLAFERLADLVAEAATPAAPRIETKPPPRAKRQRRRDKQHRARTKRLRGAPGPDGDG